MPGKVAFYFIFFNSTRLLVEWIKVPTDSNVGFKGKIYPDFKPLKPKRHAMLEEVCIFISINLQNGQTRILHFDWLLSLEIYL